MIVALNLFTDERESMIIILELISHNVHNKGEFHLVVRLNIVFVLIVPIFIVLLLFFASFDLFDHGVDRPDVVGIVVVVGIGQAGYDAQNPSNKESDAQKYCQDVVFIYFFLRRYFCLFFHFFIHDAHAPSK